MEKNPSTDELTRGRRRKSKVRDLYPWRQRPTSPIARPLCRTLDVTHEATNQRYSGSLVDETYRCVNGHRWSVSRSVEEDRISSWSLLSGELPYGVEVIRCPKCGEEAEYRGRYRGVCICGSCGYSKVHVLRW